MVDLMRRDGFCPMCGTPCTIVGEAESGLNGLRFERKEPEPVQLPCTHAVDPLLTAWQRLASMRCSLAKRQNKALPHVEINICSDNTHQVSLFSSHGVLWHAAGGNTFAEAVDVLATIVSVKEHVHV